MQLVNVNNKTTKINKRENFNVYLLCLHWHNGYCGSFTRDQKATYEAAKQALQARLDPGGRSSSSPGFQASNAK